MKATGLMIGDWVKDKYKPKPHQVDSWADFNSAEDLFPIPLTDEILEKNGFVLNSFDRWMNEDYGIALSTRDDFYFIWDRIQINFVHEFQHAIRFVGLDELANDFKI